MQENSCSHAQLTTRWVTVTLFFMSQQSISRRFPVAWSWTAAQRMWRVDLLCFFLKILPKCRNNRLWLKKPWEKQHQIHLPLHCPCATQIQIQNPNWTEGLSWPKSRRTTLRTPFTCRAANADCLHRENTTRTVQTHTHTHLPTRVRSSSAFRLQQTPKEQLESLQLTSNNILRTDNKLGQRTKRNGRRWSFICGTNGNPRDGTQIYVQPAGVRAIALECWSRCQHIKAAYNPLGLFVNVWKMTCLPQYSYVKRRWRGKASPLERLPPGESFEPFSLNKTFGPLTSHISEAGSECNWRFGVCVQSLDSLSYLSAVFTTVSLGLQDLRSAFSRWLLVKNMRTERWVMFGKSVLVTILSSKVYKKAIKMDPNSSISVNKTHQEKYLPV